jgi:Arc/MetJ-type ribon-helix-helix transcriptional regulator
MYRTHVYLTLELKNEIEAVARFKRSSKSEIIRASLEQGLKTINQGRQKPSRILVELAKAAKRFDVSGPNDLAAKHNEYTWD